MSSKLKYDEVLREEVFYPPSDDRKLKSNIYSIHGGDNFADYAEYIFDLYEEEEWYEN